MTNITTKRIEVEKAGDGAPVVVTLYTDHLTGEQEAAILTARNTDPDQIFHVMARNTRHGPDTARLVRARRVLGIWLA
jgi:hypothetical protein